MKSDRVLKLIKDINGRSFFEILSIKEKEDIENKVSELPVGIIIKMFLINRFQEKVTRHMFEKVKIIIRNSPALGGHFYIGAREKRIHCRVSNSLIYV